MKTKNQLSNIRLNSGFVAGFLTSTFIFLLLNGTPGVTKENLKEWLNKSDHVRHQPPTNYPITDGKHVEVTIQYLDNGEIRFLDDKNNSIQLPNSGFIAEGPLLKHHTVSFLTLKGDLSKNDVKNLTLGFLDHIITPANATDPTYETHVATSDSGVVNCKVHKITSSSHVFDHKC